MMPDLTTLGKIVGGGLPVGAFGGRREIMDYIAPSGPVYQAGTLSGNPLAVAAGLTTLNALTPDLYVGLEAQTEKLITGLLEAAQRHGHQACENHVCGMFSIFFGVDAVNSYDDVASSDVEKFNKFFHGMLDAGIYLAPSAFEAGFMSVTHADEHIEATLSAADAVLANLPA